MSSISHMAQMTGDAKAMLNIFCESRGYQQKRVLQSLLEWFAGLPGHLHCPILSLIPESIETEVARLLLRHPEVMAVGPSDAVAQERTD